MAYECKLTQRQILQYIHYNRLYIIEKELYPFEHRHHNTMMIQHNAKRIVELKLDQPAASLVMVRRRIAGTGNPVDFFDKSFAEYKQGFSLNGEFLRDVSS